MTGRRKVRRPTVVRNPECKSRHRGDCWGTVEACAGCGAKYCAAEGGTDLIDLCDDCWHAVRSVLADCQACGWQGPPRADETCPACNEEDLAQVTPEPRGREAVPLQAQELGALFGVDLAVELPGARSLER